MSEFIESDKVKVLEFQLTTLMEYAEFKGILEKDMRNDFYEMYGINKKDLEDENTIIFSSLN